MLLILLAASLSIAISSLQNEFEPATFEFQEYCTYEGVIMENPYPRILIERPGDTGALPSYSQYFLTVFGKESAAKQIEGMDGISIKFDAALIYKDNQTMLELADTGVEEIEALEIQKILDSQKKLPAESLGEHTIAGEIVDSKCYLGVMNPGNLKVHKACAINCIRGGIPPVLLAKDEAGNVAYYLLEDEEGNDVTDQVLDKVAEPIEITGEVMRQGDLLILRANPDNYKNL